MPFTGPCSPVEALDESFATEELPQLGNEGRTANEDTLARRPEYTMVSTRRNCAETIIQGVAVETS